MVYVDALEVGIETDAQARRVGARNGNRWCHLMADTSDELRAFASRIGMRPQWIQYAGTPKEHFDLTPARRAHAVRLGAKETDGRGLVALMRRKRAPACAEGEGRACGAGETPTPESK